MSQSVRQRFDPSVAPSVSVLFTEKVSEGLLSFSVHYLRTKVSE